MASVRRAYMEDRDAAKLKPLGLWIIPTATATDSASIA